MYTLIGGPNNRTFRVLWMLEELGLPYERQDAHPHDPLVREKSPLGKIPVLMVDDVPLTDSVAILTWLADSTGRMTAPAGSLARAQQDGLTQQIVDELEGQLWIATRHSFILPTERRVPEIKPTLAWEFARNCDVLASRMQGDFLMGDEMTVPDLLLAHCLNWAVAAKFEVPNEALQAYGARMRSRDAYRRAVASEKELLAARQASESA
ncbi:glutathione S-transferase [Pseudooceanicola antarcticus]|uniref:Glutathione S-transferase n=1 Tax=Pseudooceanicola antarcticus TaxID=1247613 RepID=A0A285HP05_9RHOB|nr:glutathione S-transferase family protein [Pseudooceanicola antarcticus]PJE27723.1 glutathione S-transferase family protein [Pseudooceanicola antarcticus]SNY37469.1 glutathione S-transferase [Pseudooceanicola antarcticus]